MASQPPALTTLLTSPTGASLLGAGGAGGGSASASSEAPGGSSAPSFSSDTPAMAPQRSAAHLREYDLTEHLLSLPELAARFGTSLDEARPDASRGLRAAQLPALRARHGSNALTPPRETPWWWQFLSGAWGWVGTVRLRDSPARAEAALVRLRASPAVTPLSTLPVTRLPPTPTGFGDMFMVLLNVAGAFCILASGLGGWDRTNLTLGLVLFAVVFLTVTMMYLQERQTSAVMATFKRMLPAVSAGARACSKGCAFGVGVWWVLEGWAEERRWAVGGSRVTAEGSG